MTIDIEQRVSSGDVDRGQIPASVARPTVRAPRPPSYSGEQGTEHHVGATSLGTTLSGRRPAVEMPKQPNLELEEFFEAVIEELTDDAIQLRTTSSQGEEGIAWLDLAQVPDGEKKYLELGAPVRISILMRRDGTNRREHQIRVLRPFQWRPAKPNPAVSSYLLEQMKAVLR